MRILVFCPYYPPHIGGLETHSDEFNKHLAQNGTDVVVFTPNIPYTRNVEEIKYDRVKIVRYPAFEIIPNYPVPKFWSLGFWNPFIILFHSDFDIVISRTRFFLSSLLALIYAKLARTYWIHIEHGSDFVKLSNPLKSAVAKVYDLTFGRIIFCFSNINISISRAVQGFVVRFDKRPSPIIYRGIDFASIDTISADDTIKQKYPGKIIISTAARLYKWKGIEFTIEAIRALPEVTRAKIVFLIMGDGEDFTRLKSLTANLPIEMLGNLPREEVLAILKSSDIYIHSSLPGGGLSTSLLEAMYCQCAIVATKNEGADEIIIDEKTGFLIDAPNEARIVEKIGLLITDIHKRTLLAEAGHAAVFQRFDWEKTIKQYLKIFKNI
ncbi:MAG: glycosyltransferase family 4 protein [Candidatus Moraniibacteriota bacterium]